MTREGTELINDSKSIWMSRAANLRVSEMEFRTEAWHAALLARAKFDNSLHARAVGKFSPCHLALINLLCEAVWTQDGPRLSAIAGRKTGVLPVLITLGGLCMVRWCPWDTVALQGLRGSRSS